ncbi:MAG: hypothetical protein AAGD05_00070 [Bacteroidota bacterium]
MKKLIQKGFDQFQNQQINLAQLSKLKGGGGDTSTTDDDIVVVDLISG